MNTQDIKNDGPQKQLSHCLATADDFKIDNDKTCLMNDETQISQGSYTNSNNNSFQSDLFDALDY